MSDENLASQRRLPACERCRARKTKCDSLLPSCSNCTKAGVECVNNDKILGRSVTRSYVWSLEERIRAFEERRDSAVVNEQHRDKRPRLSDSRQSQSVSQYDRGSSPETLQVSAGASEFNHSPPSLTDDDKDDDDDTLRSPMNTLIASTLSGCATSHVSEDLRSQIRQFSGSFAGRGAREIFIEKEILAITKLGRDFLKQARRNTIHHRATDLGAYDSTLIARVAKRYFTWMNSAQPVLHECIFHLQLEKYRNTPTEVSPLDSFQVNMAMAISLASISRSHLATSEIGRIAHDFWKLATKSLNHVLCSRGLPRLQSILMLLQYTLLVPKAGNLWQLSGTAMGFATEMGLNAEPAPGQAFDPLSLDLRRRVFWTCYCIDRVLATVTGRPTGVPDVWITAKMPALVEDRLITVDEIQPGPTCQLKVAQIQQILICQLRSEIHGRLYAPASQYSSLQEDLTPWTWHMYDQLRVWRDSFTYPTPLITKEWTELQFHIAVVLLLRPSPRRPNPSDVALHVAFHSAGEAMKLYKTMHRDRSADFSWLTVHNLFMCGLTFINSLKDLIEKTPSRGLCTPIVDIFLQIQACSAMLETLSTLEAGTNERIRNVFEMASSNVLHSLANIAPSLDQQRNAPSAGGNQSCIWAQIATYDDLSLKRPIDIDGRKITVQTTSNILNQASIHQRGDGMAFDMGPDDGHFYDHDVDAAGSTGVLRSPVNASLYSKLHSHVPQHSQDDSRQENFTLSGRLPNQVAQESPSSSADMAQHLQELQRVGMDRLAVISNIAAEAEPLRTGGVLPEWFESNLDAELERWFLYPFLEVSPPVSTMASDQAALQNLGL